MTRRHLQSLLRDNKGAVAIEFAILAMTFVMMILGCIQFSLFLLSRIAMHDALADLATGEGHALLVAADRDGTRDFICDRILLSPNCRSALQLEMRELQTASASSTSTTFARGTAGRLMVVRAEAPIVVFVPFIETLRVRGRSVFLQPPAASTSS